MKSLDNTNLGLYLEKVSNYTSNYYYGKLIDSYVSLMYWTIDNKRNFTVEFASLCRLKNYMLKDQLESNQKVLDKTI